MRFIGCFVLMIAISITPSLYGQATKPLFFTGSWINTQFEDYKSKQKSLNFLGNISPHYLLIDSVYNLTVIWNLELRSVFGKPISRRNYEPIQELRYKIKNEIRLEQIPGEANLISLVFVNGGACIIFKRE